MMCIHPHPFLKNCNTFIVLFLLLQIINWGHVLVVSAVFSVDTFLLLSGALLSYVFLEYGGRKFNILIYFIHRYLR